MKGWEGLALYQELESPVNGVEGEERHLRTAYHRAESKNAEDQNRREQLGKTSLSCSL